jgi:hypothetical protein
MPNQQHGAGRADEQQAVETTALSPNPVLQLGGVPFQAKQDVTQPSVTGMDSVEESFSYPVSGRSGTTVFFWLLLNVCGTVSNTSCTMHLSIQKLGRKFVAAVSGVNKVRFENRSIPHHTHTNTLNHSHYVPHAAQNHYQGE